MQLRKLLVNILLFGACSLVYLALENDKPVEQSLEKFNTEQTLIPGLKLNVDRWIAIDRSPHLYSFQSRNGLDQLHLGRKPYFQSVVPTALELYRTLFQQISSESALDWKTLGIQPGDQRLHQARLKEVWIGYKVALDIVPVFINSQPQSYAIATFLYKNHPVYFISKQVNDLSSLKTLLLSTFSLE
ncbi:MAG: hypothetical protein VX619_09065 [bacterium]|nr:hypothetical protein [bacterium]